MTWNDIALQAVQALMPVVVAALVALIGYGVAYLRKQTEKIDNEIVQQALWAALGEAEQVAKDAVYATNQVLVDKLKAASADGKLTEEEARLAMAKAKDYFISHISEGSMDILMAALGPIQLWLESFLEAKLGEQKQQAAKIPNPL
ncbi:MAG: hypothetical protein WBH42_03605 [Bacillota bacterium]